MENKDILPVFIPDSAGSWLFNSAIGTLFYKLAGFTYKSAVDTSLLWLSCVELMLTKVPPGLETMLRTRQVGKEQVSGDGRWRNRDPQIEEPE